MTGFLQVIICTLFALWGSSAKDINVVRMRQQNDLPVFEENHHKTNNEKAGTFRFASYFQDHMVLQQAPKRARIYGFSPSIGQKVLAMVTINTTKYYYDTVVDEGPEPGVGKWVFTLAPIKTSSSASIYVASDLGSLTLKDVLFGDVWLCSGQSNMQFTLSMMFNGTEEIAKAHEYPNIRVMTVAMEASQVPLYDLIGIERGWSLPSNDSVGGKEWTYFSAVCWLYGKALHKTLGYPIGLIASDWGGTPVAAWSSPDALAQCNTGSDRDSHQKRHSSSEMRLGTNEKQSEVPSVGKLHGPQNDTVLWNAMIHPFLGLTFFGAIWYQGENDAVAGLVDHYNCTFPAMIDDWRLKFNEASIGQTEALFPFGFVQLAPTAPHSSGNYFPDIRWHQTADTGAVPNDKMSNVFMAVAIDLPDNNSPFGTVHPEDKQDVATRLALAGLAVAYHHDLYFQGPLPYGLPIQQHGELFLDYGNDWKLVVNNYDGFEVLCVPTQAVNQVWVPALIVNSTETSISVSTDKCASDIGGIRYAWAMTPCRFKDCAVYGTVNYLPAPPFIKYF